MQKPVILVPDQVLHEQAKPVTKVDKRIKNIIKDLKDTLIAQRDPIGVGLSGNQINQLLRMFVIRPEEDGEITVMINPETIDTIEGSDTRKPTLEGCLSIPQTWGYVLRPEKVKFRYIDETEKERTLWLEGFGSIVAQHELDHLDGILFTQRVVEQGRQLYTEVAGELQPYEL